MTHSFRKTRALIAILLMFAVLSLSSCASQSLMDGISVLLSYVDDDSAESGSESGSSPSDPNTPSDSAPSQDSQGGGNDDSNDNDSNDEESSVVIDQTIVNNTITIEGASSDLSAAASSALRSSVSVWCTFSSSIMGGTEKASAGSGVIYSFDPATGSALILTNYHVVYQKGMINNGISRNINLYLYGMEYTDYAIPATFVGGSIYYDIAVLQVKSNQLLREAAARGSVAAVTFADSDAISAGQTAMAIGNAKAGGISVTTGIVSVESEYLTMTAADDITELDARLIRVDTAVNSGNSGGGLFNDRGELIGIVNAKIISNGVENIGYAIPSSLVSAVADNIVDHCLNTSCRTVMRCLSDVTFKCSRYYTVYDTETGLLVRMEEIAVRSVTSGGLGATALKQGDRIVSVTVGSQTVTLTYQHQLIEALLGVRAGDTVSFRILRNGQEQTVSVTVTADHLSAY